MSESKSQEGECPTRRRTGHMARSSVTCFVFTLRYVTERRHGRRRRSVGGAFLYNKHLVISTDTCGLSQLILRTINSPLSPMYKRLKMELS